MGLVTALSIVTFSIPLGLGIIIGKRKRAFVFRSEFIDQCFSAMFKYIRGFCD